MKPARQLLLLAATSTLLAGCASSTNKATGAREVEPVVLTLANWQIGDSDVGEWTRAVERLSDGAVRIEIRGGWRRGELLNDRGTLRDVRAGRVDIGHIPARAWDTLGVDSFRALDAPLLVDSLELEERVVSELGAAMLDGVRTAGVEPLMLMPGPLRRPVGTSHELLGPADYRGALIALRPSAVEEATMQALGARVAGIPALESLAGVDGTELDVAGLDVDADVNWEQARSVTANVVLWPRATTLVMNRDRWRGLTEGQRAVLEDAARAAVEPVMERERRLERGGTRTLCDRNFALARASAGELAALRRALEPVYTRLEGDGDTRAALERIRSLKEDAPAASTPACPSTQEKAVPSDAPVVGIWQVHVTREDMADAPRVTGERVEDNWGTITLELGADGSFEMLNDRFPDGPAGLGTWSIRGDVLTFMPGGTVSMGAGETWRYRWTLFRGSLVLRRLSRDAGPTVLMVAPLRRR